MNGLDVKRLRAFTEGPEFEFRGWDRGCALLRSPIIERNSRPVLQGSQWWSNIIRPMISINKVLFMHDFGNVYGHGFYHYYYHHFFKTIFVHQLLTYACYYS